ncbi:hypothetical protein D3C86_1178120 [compost metagenome]
MNEWIGSPLSVQIGASGRFESQPTIKTHGLAVLFVDVSGQRGMKRKRPLHQCLADALAMMVRIDEKRLHMPFMQKHETEDMVRSIDRQRQRRLRQERFDFLPDRGAIRRQEELVGGVDCFAPYVEDAGSVAALGGTKCDHVSPLASAEFSRHWPIRSFP